MAVAKVDICNQALGMLRANLITNFDADLSVEAKLCRANYDRLREAVLEDKEWRFATRRMKLAQSADAPVFGWTYKFKVPADVLRVLTVTDRVNRDNINDNDINWEREEDFVLTNTKLAYARATVNIVDTTKFSAGFVQAFATRMASIMAVPLTGSNTRAQELMNEYLTLVGRAATKDGMQGKARKRRPGRLETARYKGGGGFENITDG
jgi:hypothetical protein